MQWGEVGAVVVQMPYSLLLEKEHCSVQEGETNTWRRKEHTTKEKEGGGTENLWPEPLEASQSLEFVPHGDTRALDDRSGRT